MKQDHEEIIGILPDYIRGSLTVAVMQKVRAHLGDCAECRSEHAFLAEMRQVDVPDPGDLYWKALPRRVKGEVGQRKKARLFGSPLFLRPLSIAAAAALIAIVLTYTLYPDRHDEQQAAVPIYHDPLSAALPDYSGLEEKDIPVIGEEIAQDALLQETGGIPGCGYYRDLESLDAEEMENLAEVLKEQKETGG